MAINKRIAICDSSALVAFIKRDDADHTKAIELLDTVISKQDVTLLVPQEVLAETLNIIGKKQGKVAAVAAGRVLLDRIAEGLVVLLSSDVQTVCRALDWQATAKGGPSFIDCLVMAHADEEQTDIVFGFDAAFAKNGYRLPTA